MHHILFYDYVADILDRRGPHRPGHLEHIAAAKAQDGLLMAGALGDPVHGGVFIFGPEIEPAAIERFAAGDPYVAAGLVAERRIEPWTVV